MIEMSYNEARAISRSRELVLNLVESKLGFSVGYNLRKILDKIGQAAQEFDLFELNLQRDLAQKLAEKNEDGTFKTELPEGKADDADRVISFTEENRSTAAREMFQAVQTFGARTLKIERKKLDLSKEDVKVRLVDMPLMDLFVQDMEAGLSPGRHSGRTGG
jgi:hypothetical protein